MRSKAIRTTVRDGHPDATGKDIVRATFHPMAKAPVQGAAADPHDIALAGIGRWPGSAARERIIPTSEQTADRPSPPVPSDGSRSP